ncbi:MAG: DUF1566 domain-containing protein [Limnohabitans sp.]|nr:DUF1566 domain-containing protein [Limnohabitans sp.]
MTFPQALNKAAELKNQGWRLPGIKELFSLVTYGPGSTSLDVDAYPMTPENFGNFYVSSTPSVSIQVYVWGILFNDQWVRSQSYVSHPG